MDRLKVGAEFCGWPTITRLLSHTTSSRDKLLMLTLFKTGGRISEVLDLSKSDIHLDESKYSVIVKDMKVVKKYTHKRDESGKKIIGQTIPIEKRRSFPILRSEPLTNELEELVKKVRHKTLFYGRSMTKPMDRSSAWRIVSSVGKRAGVRVSDHWFRGMRDGQLREDYGFIGDELDSFFGWGATDEKVSRRRYGMLSWKALEFAMLKGQQIRQQVYGETP